ncbi:MAG TPA: 2-hydroxyacid dehydrogenase [Kofleriaceae bacterium]|nr:2-hydroxyacid dehydrogenase [Kofleriaceae bacterium]
MKPDVLVVELLYPQTLAALDAAYVTHKVWLAPDRNALIDSVAERIEAAATSTDFGMDAPTMDKLPALKLISHFGVGVDAIDVEAARKRGIAITNTPGVLDEDVADIALLLLLSVVRKVFAGDRYARDGSWLKGEMTLTDSVQEKTLGIIGLGRIGRAVARRAMAFNMRIGYTGPNRKNDVDYAYYPDANTLAAESDFLVAACPGGAATRGVVSRTVLEALGPSGVFVNVARGSVVDEAALVQLLRAGRLGGAGLDVFADEPRIPDGLRGMGNVVLQPHVGSGTHRARRAMGQIVVDNLAAYFAGRPLVSPY